MIPALKRNGLSSLERIRSRRLFDAMFSSGKSLKSFPVRMMWMETPVINAVPVRMAVSVPKRWMHDAVDRNRMKRLVRESYRINKHTLSELLSQKEKSLALLFIVQSKTPLTFKETQEKIILLLQRLIQHYERPAEPDTHSPD
jgi:ribonuclease P protein component